MPDLQVVTLGGAAGEQQAEQVEEEEPQEPRLCPVCLLQDTDTGGEGNPANLVTKPNPT